MNKVFRSVVFGILSISISCNKADELQQGCNVKVSELVYNGKFLIEDIRFIRIINGVTQNNLYPVPDWSKSKNLIEISDQEFFKKFKSALNAAGWETEASTELHVAGNVQIQVAFKSGPAAYLFCRTSERKFGVSPMFRNDCYGNENEPLFDLVNNAIGASATK
jgi:hypothetical protein